MWPLLDFGWTRLGSYGLMVSLGYFIGAAFIWRHLWDMRGTRKKFWQLGYMILFGAFVGGKLGYVLVEWEAFRAEPWLLVTTWRSGWVFWGGLLGTFLMGLLYREIHNRFHRPRAMLPVADYWAPALALGHAVGRLGCLMRGCCYGKPTTLPWGVRFTHPGCEVPEELMGVPLHPVQFYEAAWEGVLALSLIFWVLPRIRAKKFTYGTSFLLYVAGYAVMRFFLEFLRADDRGSFLWPVL